MRRMNTSRIALLLAALASGAAAAEFKIGPHTFTLPEGFVIEKVAGPPLVDRPIVADFDPQGRLYVADSSGSNDRVEKQLQEKPHRIVRLEDTNDDGIFDQTMVFADKMMFPEGMMYLNGSVYCGAPPSVWKLTDTNNDGKADERMEWYQGKVLTGCANDVHGPYYGIDGMVYWTKGAFAKLNLERPGEKPINDSAAHIFRAKPDGTGLESIIRGGMDNPVEVAFLPTGESIFTTTFYSHPKAGERDGLVHAIYGGVYPKTHGVLDGLIRTGDLMPILTHMGPAAPSGLTTYRSTAFGKDYKNNLFSTSFNLRKVVRHILKAKGGTYATEDIDFVVSDNHDFHPTDVFEDADGSLLIIDTGGWYKLCCPTSQLAKPDVLGAIYRVRRTNAPKVSDAHGLAINWQTAPPTELIKLLDDSRPVVRDKAIKELSDRQAVPDLTQALKTETSPERRLNALWALNRMDLPLAREAIRSGLKDSDKTIVHAALHSIGLWRDREAELSSLLTNSSVALRREAATAMGRIQNRTFVDPLLSAAGESGDMILDHSIIYALIEINSPEQTAKGLQSSNPKVARAALIALDQMEQKTLTAAQMAAFLQKDELRSTALWLVSNRPEHGDALAGVFQKWLQQGRNYSQELAQLSKSSAIQNLLAETVASPKASAEAKKIALRAMRQAQNRPAPESWVEATYKALEVPEVQKEAVYTAVRLALPKTNKVDIEGKLMSLANGSQLDAETRLEILSRQPGKPPLNDKLFDFLVKEMASGNPPLRRGTAAAVLGRANLTQEQISELSLAVKPISSIELTKLFPAFHEAQDADAIFSNLSEAQGIKLIRADQLGALVRKLNSKKSEGEALLKRLNINLEEQQQKLAHLETTLNGGDMRRGQAIFNGPKALCATCHTVGYVGGNVGPDLTRVGAIRTNRDLIESIVFPSASLARSYETMVFKTRDGEEYSGVLRTENNETLVITTGPGTEHTLSRTEVVEARPGGLSLMPEGLDQQLSQQELSDLLAFLKSLK